MALQFARDYYAEEGLAASESPIYIPPVSDLTPEAESEAQRRQSPEKHQVKGALVDLGDRRASEEAKEKYRQATGGDELPDGKTCPRMSEVAAKPRNGHARSASAGVLTGTGSLGLPDDGRNTDLTLREALPGYLSPR
ncbi:hypothetical protein [Streptomyces sp. IBSBF 2390]|uniref:hypothetical protein n=1 Tax=Streptomyces sp. IBSBF 2390 TaxID=2903533 RepID=UPI002FDC3AC1